MYNFCIDVVTFIKKKKTNKILNYIFNSPSKNEIFEKKIKFHRFEFILFSLINRSKAKIN